jgi:hypothetical protein
MSISRHAQKKSLQNLAHFYLSDENLQKRKEDHWKKGSTIAYGWCAFTKQNR